MKMLVCITALLGGLFSGTTSRAGEIPPLTLPAGVGVNIHFIRGHERDLDLIAAAGFKFIRQDFFWTETERERGQYDWSGFDELLNNLDRHGLRAYFILDYSHPLYEAEVTGKNPITGQTGQVRAAPHHPESIAAFACWAAAAAKHFQGRHVIWEIWNEPNGNFWEPQPDVQQYTTLALATLKAVREADPQATLVGPAASGLPWPFLQTFLQSGALEYLDAVSVHPYRSPRQPPETAARDYQKLRALIETNTPSARKNSIPILSGEWGYSSNAKGVSLETQAAFIARQQLFNLLNGLPISIWYDWKNDGNDPYENEHNFGTVKPDFTPKPAYVAVKTLTHELSGFSLAKRFATASTNDFVLVFTNGNKATKLAAWTLGDPHEVSISVRHASAKEISAVNGGGEKIPLALNSGALALPLASAPTYATLGKAALK